MTVQAGSSGGVSGGQPSVFTRGFLPGLVLGIVIGAVVGFISTEIIGGAPKIEPGTGAVTTTGEQGPRDRDGPGGAPTREELEQMAREAKEAADAEGENATPPADAPEEDDG